MENIKRYAVIALVAFNVALAGAVFGAYEMHTYDARQSTKTAQAVQSALKTVSVTVPKVQAR